MAIFAIDFDGTIVKDEYPDIGEPITDAMVSIKEIKKLGHKIIIWTCRVEPQLSDMKNFLLTNEVPFDHINENCPAKIAYYNNDTRKIGADYYIDDKMVGIWTWNDVLAIAKKQAVKKDICQIKNIDICNMQQTFDNKKITYAKPFLKWAGGKTQLLDELDKRLPANIIKDGVIENYVEPFVGGGAMFFYLKKKYVIKSSCLLDVNPELIISYLSIKKNSKKLINILKIMEQEYLAKSNEERSAFFYQVRSLFNEEGKNFDYKNYNSSWIDRTAKLIFLNKTCFNGLFRQNSKGEFNVPFGKYKKPKICDEVNINEVSKALRDTTIVCGDFEESALYINEETLVYLDPPYRPLSATSSFTDYAKGGFTDNEQKRLAEFFRRMDAVSAHLILSNSDPKNENPNDQFFDILYNGFHIDRVKANRMINCQAEGRGYISELIITNY